MLEIGVGKDSNTVGLHLNLIRYLHHKLTHYVITLT